MNFCGRLERNRAIAVILLAIVWSFNASFVYSGINHFLIDVFLLLMLIDFFGAINVNGSDLLIIGAVWSFLFIQSNDVSGSCMTASVVWMEYLIGKGIGKELFSASKKSVPFCLGGVGLVLGLKGFLTYTWLFSHEYTARFPMWGTGMVLPRTQHEYFLIMMASILIFWILYMKNNKRSLFGVVLSMLTIAICLYGKGRMGTCDAIVVLIIVGVLYTIENKSAIDLKLIIKRCGCALLSFLVLFLDKGQVYQLITRGNWSDDGGIFRNVRFLLWKEALKLIVEHPMGSSDIKLVPYDGRKETFSHNTWIDVGRFGGVIPFALLVCFTIVVFVYLFKFWKREKSVEKYALISVFLGMTLYCLFEPVLNANPYFFCGEVFLSGMVVGAYYAKS